MNNIKFTRRGIYSVTEISMKKILKQAFLNALQFKIVNIDDVFDDIVKTHLIYPEIIPTPDAEEINFVTAAKDLQSQTCSTPLGYSALIKGVLYSPEYNILLTEKREVIVDSFIPHSRLEDFNFKISWLYQKDIETISGHCLIFDQLTQNNYYHILVDNVPRFYVACQHDIVQSGERIELLHTSPIANNHFLNRLKPGNVEFRQLQIGKLYYIENLIFSPFITNHFCGHIPSVVRNKIYSRFLPDRSRNPKNLIYISRKKAPQGRRILNESELFDSLKKLGFEEYVLEDLSALQQIDIFYDAKLVVAPHGAGLTNLIFSHQVKILELFQMKYITPNYYYLAKSMEHDYAYWTAPVDIENPWADFTVNIDEVIGILKNKFCIFNK
jgi:capsular polysaccharide biosynthesis protein